MVGKAKIFSDQNRESVYQKESDDENYAAAAQQNSYNLGSVHFSDQSGIANISQAGTDQRKANLKGALFTGNVGFDLQTALLDVGSETIDLNNDSAGTVLSIIPTDRFVTLSAGTTADLTTITGAQRPGQRLRLYNTLSNTITIKHTAGATVNTIRTTDASDLIFPGDACVDLTWDITAGQWRVVGLGVGAGGATGTYASAVMDQDQVANMGVNDHFQFNDFVENGGIVLQGQTPTFDQTSGIFELKEGKIYYLEADVSAEFNSNADSSQIAWYDRTNAVELGARGKSNPLSSAGQLTNKHSVNTIITPSTDIDVEVRIVALTGTINTAFSSASQANIFELTGPGGGAGSSPLTTKGDIFTYDTDDARLPVGADGEILSADSAELTGLKWIPAGAGLQTPWLSNIDADNFFLFDLGEVIFDNTVINAPVIGKQSIFWSFSTGDQVHQIQPGNDFKIIQGDNEVVGQTVATFNDSTIDFSIQTLPFTVLETGDLLNKGIAQFNNTVTLKTNNVAFPQPTIRPSTDVVNPNDGGDLGTNTVPWNNLNVKQLRLRDGAVIIDIASIAYDSAFAGTVYNVPNGESHLFKQFDGAASTDTLFEINETEIDAFVKNIVNVVDPVNPQDAATKKYVDDNVGPAGGGDIFAQVVKEFSLPTSFNNTTLTNDAELKFEAEAQKVYYIEFNVKTFSSNAADIKYGMSIPTAATYQMAFSSLGVDFTDPPTASGGTTLTFGASTGNPLSANFFVIVEMGVNAGEVVLSFAQNNADTTNTTVQRGSLMRAYEQGSGGGSGGVTQDILLGVIDEPEFRVEDINRQWVGNDNGVNNLNINLGTSEPGGFTNTYTIDSNDFPDTPAGWDFILFGMMGTWTVENTGASSTYEYKIFINGREISNQTGTVTLWLSPSAYTTLDDVQSGDVIQIKVWSTSASNDLYLRQRGIFLFPKAAKCIADMISVTPTPTANTFVATLPSGVTATLTTGEVAEYYVTNDEVWNVDDDGFPDFEPYNYGFVQILLNAEQIIRIPEWDRDTRTSSSSTNVFQVPEWQVPYGKYRTTS